MTGIWKAVLLIVYFLQLFIVQYTIGDSTKMSCIETVELIPPPPPPPDEEEYEEEEERLRFTPVGPVLTTCSYVNLTIGPLPLDPYKSYNCEHYCPGVTYHKLTVIKSFIPTIVPSTFIHHPSTNILVLEKCGIQNILPGAFNILTRLEELHLSDNNITYISDGIFNSLVNLKTLDLSMNKIRNLSQHVFSGAFNIEKINMSHNCLKYVDSKYFIHVQRLTEFDISFNKIEIFNFTGFKVTNLNVSNNLIENVYGCFGTFAKLHLNNNLLTSLKNVVCNSNVSNTVTLDLSYNSLQRLDKISNLNNLKKLSLQNNNVNYLSTDFFSELRELVFLNLSSNQLDQFQYGLFDRLRKLETLDVSNNHLTEFRKFNYHLLTSLRVLYLNDNKIITLDFKDLTKVLYNLVTICIWGNNFTCDMLVDIFHNLKQIVILPGHTFNSSNIHGIACSEDDKDIPSLEEDAANTTVEETTRIHLNKLFNSDFTKSSMYNYFNRDFKKTNFYKYLENLQIVGNLSANSYNSNINNMKNMQELQKQFNKSVIGYFNKDFLNSTFVKYLETFKNNEDFLKNDVKKSAMYNYFNRDFENSNFYKYLEALKRPQFAIKYSDIDTNKTQVEKLVNTLEPTEERNENSGLLIVIIILLFVISCIMLSFMYISYTKSRKIYNISNEQVELIET